jgi:anthranilate phosphoribosyltransferase
MTKATPEELKGGDADRNAAIIRSILAGTHGPQRRVVVLNAGAGLFVAGRAGSIPEGIRMASEAIDSGAAQGRLEQLVRSSREAAAV